MIRLIPSWAHHYDEFWKALRARNLWFIKLRYGVAAFLAILLISIEFVIGFKLYPDQESAIIIITVSIFLYNVFLHWLRRFVVSDPDKFNPLHLSIIQMTLDLFVLTLLVYFSGSIESPLLMLFIFHMIIGSLILPGIVVYSIAVLIVAVISTLVYLEFSGIITHHSLAGFLEYPIFQNSRYIISMLVMFGFVMMVSVLLANKIAKQLYKMEQELVESLEKLKTAETEKQKYIMGVVHEIKTPLTALHSYLDLVLQNFLGPVNSQIEEKLTRAKMRSTEAIQMINNVLKISRLRLLNEIASEPVDPGEVICPILEKQKVTFRNKNISVTYSDNRLLKHKIKGDIFLLEIAFSNLISNALKYSNEKGIVSVGLSETSEIVQINICDNGIGIPTDEVKRIFEDFFRASNIKHGHYEGTGLGLSIVKKIVESHGGTIAAESPSPIGTQENPGACFLVKFPVDKKSL